MMWNILKNIFLGFFGIGVISIGLTITSHFVKELSEDNFMLAYISITWAAYITCKTLSEYHHSKK